MTGLEIKAALAFVLIALGVTAPIPDFFGGVLLGLGACSLVFVVAQPASRKSFGTRLAVGLIVTLLAA
ncbi:MAG: hypothetical protein ACK5NN_11360, partial [Sphingomonadaceae bacterium]